MIGAKPVWGIDIGAHAIKGVKLLARADDFEVIDFDVLPHRGDPEPTEGPIGDRRAWRTLALFQERHCIRAEHVIVSVPGKSVFTRPLEVIEVAGKPLADLVRYEVRQQLGIDLDAVLWDYELFPAKEANARNREGVLFAMKKVDYNIFIRSLSAARVSVDDVQSLPLAIFNYVKHDLDTDSPLLAIDIGATSVNLVAVYEGRHWSRTLPIGGSRITAELQQGFNCDFASAESIKINAGQSSHARDILQRMLPGMRAIVSEIQNAMNLLRSDVGHVTFDRAVVLGGAARTLGLSRLISQELGCNVITPELLANMPLGEDVDRQAIKEAAPALAGAAGLALQGADRASTEVSLVSAGTVRGKHLARTRPFAIASLAVAAAFVALNLVFGYIELDRLDKANQDIDTRLAPVEGLRHRWRKVSLTTRQEERLQRFHALGKHRDGFLACLRRMASIFSTTAVQRRLWLRSLKITMARSDHPDKRYTTTETLHVLLEGATQRKSREKDLVARESVKSIVKNHLHGLEEITDKPDVLTTTSAQLDGGAAVTDDSWQYMFFQSEFNFRLDLPEKEGGT